MKILDIGSKDEIPSFASRINPHAPKLKILLDYVLIMYLEGGNAIRINPQALFDFEGLCQIQAKYCAVPDSINHQIRGKKESPAVAVCSSVSQSVPLCHGSITMLSSSRSSIMENQA